MAFLGIKVPVETGRLLKGIDVPGESESPSEYHITLLCFEDNWKISEVSRSLEATYDVISEIKPFLVKTELVTSFPKREGKPIPIIAKVESKDLHDLREKLAKKFDKEKIEFSKVFKDFKPHITLAYDGENDKFEDLKIDPVEFSVQEIVLWAGDHGDDRLFITFPLQGPTSSKKSSFLLQKANMFAKIANNQPQKYLTSTYERRLFERTASGTHYIPDMKTVNGF
jgi:2'-5' RNA ligase